MSKIKQPRKNAPSTPKKKAGGRKKTQRKPVEKPAYGISKLEAFFAREFLDKLGLRYIYEYEAKDIGRFYDFAIVATPPDKEVIYEEKHGVRSVDYVKNLCRVLIIIEIDGSYFHSDPRVVNENKLNPMQKHNKFVDKLKDEWCAKHHIPLLRIWEYDIRNNPKDVFKKINDAMNKLTAYERAKAGINKPHPRKG